MMATTHALAGMLLGGVVAVLAPEYTAVAILAGGAGGVFPDLDLYSAHRKTLHYPVYYSLLAVFTTTVALVAPSPLTVAIELFVLAAALHSVMDAFGGGLELRPWRGVSDRAVYDHFHGRWVAPRRWVRYDGAPEDLLLATALGVAGVLVSPATMDPYIAGAVGLSAAYALIRKPLVAVTEWLVASIPEAYLARIPERFVEDFSR